MPEKPARRIYLLDPVQLSQETIAVTFAKTSRSPLSFGEIAAELSQAKAAEFHEKWVVGYGHASVAEHAVVHIAVEDVSRLSIEAIESGRLASYTEKSTRYQKWDPDSYHMPAELQDGTLRRRYQEACELLFRTYQQSLSAVKAVVQADVPREDGESEDRWDGRIRSRFVDVCRYLLPMSALANVGITTNARSLEHTLGKMLASPLQEVRGMGADLKRVALEELPALLKHAEPSAYLEQTEAALRAMAARLPPASTDERLRLLAFDRDAERRVLAAALFAQAGAPFTSIAEQVGSMTAQQQAQLAAEALGRLGRFDIPLRELEHAVYTFEAVLDQGAYFELKRHRMMTQTPQRLTTSLGYAVPRLISVAGLEPTYREAMDRAADTFAALEAWNPAVAAYVVPNGFNRRVLMTLNLREVYHLCELRSAPNAHFSMRRLALQMAEQVRQVHPLLAGFMRLPAGASSQSIVDSYFTQL
jgi:thymidylate synthase ThyX